MWGVDTNPIRAAIYTRISQDHDGLRDSVENQLKDCTAYAERRNLTVVAHFSDNDMSATSGKRRKGYEQMLAAAGRREFDTVVAFASDRVYRLNTDLEQILAETEGLQIHTVVGGLVDLSTSEGRMVARILGSVATQECERKADRQRAANRHRRDAGQWQGFGTVPFGYEKHGEPRRLRITPLEPEATMVRQAAAHVLAGGSLRSIARDWNRQGVLHRGRLWSAGGIRTMLENPVYAALVTAKRTPRGKRQDRAVVAKGEWEPLIDEETHLGLVALFNNPERTTGLAYERKWLGSGIYECGICGGKLYISNSHGKPAYRCGAKRDTDARVHLSRAQQPLDELVAGVVLTMLGATDLRARLAGRSDIDVDAMRTQRAALKARESELADMFASGEISGEALRRGSAELRARLAAIDAVFADLAATSPAAVLLDGDPDELHERWQECTPDLRGKIIDELMTVIVNPARRGGGGFNPDFIDIRPKV